MSILGKGYKWVKKQGRNNWFWIRRHEANLQELFDMCVEYGTPSNLDYSSDKFKRLLRACGVVAKPRGTYDGCDLYFQGRSQYLEDWPQGSRVNVTTVCDVKSFLVNAGVSEVKEIYNHLPGT
ncbi:MAG: hypothetical protein M3362_01025 [Acidobacteriota bacterium]|nr:hypothetical protein [Acidobacteriota bacterium]